MNRALDGILVVSIEQAVAAPYASSRLADSGARVIKIERTDGDFARGYDRAAKNQSAYFVWLNRGKQSIALDFKQPDDRTLLERMIANASWDRVALILLVLAFGMAAFLTKITLLRWVSLGVTLLVLGFVDGGFLSVSHITSAIWVGPSVFLDDLPLLLMVVFTVVTTLTLTLTLT